jgi:putative transferase (TIGR04331 family)
VILQITGGITQDSFEEPLFQLGTWCADGNVRPLITASDLDPATDLNVEAETSRILKQVESAVFPALNHMHGVDYPKSFWEDSLGIYFRMLVPLLIQRYNLVKRARDVLGLSQYSKLDVSRDSVIPEDRPSLLPIINSHSWNQVTIGSICESLGLTPRPPLVKQSLPAPNLHAARQLHPESISFVKRVVRKLCNATATRSPVLITRTMLPKKLEFQLAMRLRTLPFFWIEDFEYSTATNHHMRSQIHKSLPPSAGVDEVVAHLAVSQIPKIYIEDFKRSMTFANHRLPRFPQTVFTANLHQASDLFLLWLAAARINYSRTIILQHGGVHSLCRDIAADIQGERCLADCYVTWGRPTFKSAKAIPGPVLVNVGVTAQKKRKSVQNTILLILDSSYRYPSVPRGMNGDRFAYAKLINSLVANLNTTSVRQILIRPYRGSEIWDDSLVDLLDDDPRISVDCSLGPIQQLYDKCRLAVSTSLGTSFFQTIHQDIPTMVLLDPALSPVSEHAEVQLNPLRQASLLFSSPESLATHINKTYTSLEEWWSSPSTKDGIIEFQRVTSLEPSDSLAFYHDIITSTRNTW